MSDDLHPQHDLDPDVLAALEHDLRSPAVWAEPPASLEDDLIAAIAAEATPAAPDIVAEPPTPRWLVAVAAAIFLAAGFGMGALFTGDDEPAEVAGETFDLIGTELADDADGTVELAVLRNGLWIMLDLESMPPAPDGQFYEAWIVRPDRIVSAGTFHMRNETGSIVLWAGIVPDEESVFAITLESDDGDTTPSGDFVFEADVSALADA